MTDKEFMKKIYALAFGEGAYENPVPYEAEEVVERIESFTKASFLDEDLERKVDKAIQTIWREKERKEGSNALNTIIQALNQFHTINNDNGETDSFKCF
jgi:hypothetical protein